jgi:hypothetical protein
LSDRIGPEEIRVIERLSHAIMESRISSSMNNLRREIELGNEREQELLRIALKLFNYEKRQSFFNRFFNMSVWGK